MSDVTTVLIALGDILTEIAAITDRLTPPSLALRAVVHRTALLTERVGQIAEAESERIVRRYNARHEAVPA